jgi:hypothetical protein
MISAVEWLLALRTVLIVTAGLFLGLLYLGLAPSPFPAKHARHRANRKRPTWTATPLYHSLGLEGLPAPDVALRRPRRAGATVYADLSKLSRFARQIANPNRTVAIVRAAVPPEETL